VAHPTGIDRVSQGVGMSSRFRTPALCAVTWVFSVVASAQAPTPVSPARLSVQEVIDAAIDAHPDIAIAELRHASASQRAPQEHGLPDPMISTGYSSVGKPYPGAGLGSDPNAGLGLMVTQPIPYAGKRDARALVMQREAEAQRKQVEATRLALIARVKQAYYRLAAAYQLDEILVNDHELLSTLARVSEGRYAVGQAAQQDVIRAQTQVSLLALQRERVARERRTREGELNALMNRGPDAPVARPVDLSPVPLDRTLTALMDLAVARSPMLGRDQLLASRSEAAVDVARRDLKPDFAVSAGYTYMGSMPDMFEFRVDVVVPLQKGRRRAAIAERQLTLEADRRSIDSTRLALQGRLQEDYQLAATAQQLAVLYRDAVLPQARLALESSINSYQTGAVDFLSVLTNFGSVLEYEMSYLEQLADLHVALSRLEEMAAVPLLP
jgi:cobalt-zinc-cadmium efflux system outer membrane protein